MYTREPARYGGFVTHRRNKALARRPRGSKNWLKLFLPERKQPSVCLRLNAQTYPSCQVIRNS